jgi:hypothetical protein
VAIGNDNKASFWDDSWVDRVSPKVLSPSIYAISKQKTWNVLKAITNDAWVLQLDIPAGLSVQHLQEFTEICRVTLEIRGRARHGLNHYVHLQPNLSLLDDTLYES